MIGPRIARGLGLTEAQLTRVWPFFAVYMLLFMALSIADAVGLSLFASRVGADRLPVVYSATALLSLIAIGVYLTRATRTKPVTMFHGILGGACLLFTLAWGSQIPYGGILVFGALFITREVALTLVLMHFGTFLQDYFTRAEMNRLLPVIYAGGRAGGMLGGVIVSSLAVRIGTPNLLPIVVGLLTLAWIGITRIGLRVEEVPDEDAAPAEATALPPIPPRSVRSSVVTFLRELRRCPLMIGLTATTLLFVCCRWFLAFQYTSAFEQHFNSEAEFAAFLGYYTQVALLISFMLQLFVVNRLVGRLGVPGTHLLYCTSVFASLSGFLFGNAFPLAIASRFVENELRFGIRNPVNQMMINRFTKRQRIVMRGWSLGWLIPVGTLAASGFLSILSALGGTRSVAVGGAVIGAALVLTAYRLRRTYSEFRQDPGKP